MARDIDYAALAVERAIREKFGRVEDLTDLRLEANDRTISVEHGDRTAESTRDRLQAAVRDANDYAQLWELLRVL